MPTEPSRPSKPSWPDLEAVRARARRGVIDDFTDAGSLVELGPCPWEVPDARLSPAAEEAIAAMRAPGTGRRAASPRPHKQRVNAARRPPG